MFLPRRHYKIQPRNGLLVTKPTLLYILLQTQNGTYAIVALALYNLIILVLWFYFYVCIKEFLRRRFPWRWGSYYSNISNYSLDYIINRMIWEKFYVLMEWYSIQLLNNPLVTLPECLMTSGKWWNLFRL